MKKKKHRRRKRCFMPTSSACSLGRGTEENNCCPVLSFTHSEDLQSRNYCWNNTSSTYSRDLVRDRSVGGWWSAAQERDEKAETPRPKGGTKKKKNKPPTSAPLACSSQTSDRTSPTLSSCLSKRCSFSFPPALSPGPGSSPGREFSYLLRILLVLTRKHNRTMIRQLFVVWRIANKIKTPLAQIGMGPALSCTTARFSNMTLNIYSRDYFLP